MNGIQNITAKIETDAQQEISAILDEARAQAAEITAKYEAQAKAEAEEVLNRGQKAALERGERLASVTQLECRKANLAVKQAVIEEAFELALKKLRELPEDRYVELLADLAVEASSTGREKLIFSQADRARVGKAVVIAANEKLARASAPKLPDEVTDSRAGALLDKVVTGASAILNGTAMLTLSEETRPINGGFILSDGAVEVNCSFETLVRMKKSEITGEVSAVLFP